MKKYIGRNILVIVTFLFLIIYLNINRYENYDTPWFYLDYIPIYIICFALSLLNLYCYKLAHKKHYLVYYLTLEINILFLLTGEISIALVLLTLNILLAGYIVNSLYRKNKLAGYLSLPYLIFVTYLLIVNQTIILIN